MANSYSSNTRIKIAELTEKNGIEDSNLIVVEDKDDTKKSTIHELKKALSGDAYDPDSFRFYSSKKVHDLLYLLSIDVSSKANLEDVERLQKNITSIIANNGNGTIPHEVIEARDGYDSLGERLRKDKELYDNKYVHNLPKKIIGNRQYIKGDGHVNILISDPSDNRPLTGTLKIKSKNLLNHQNVSFNPVVGSIDQSGDNVVTGWRKYINGNGLRYDSHRNYIMPGDLDLDTDHIDVYFPTPLQAGNYILSFSAMYAQDYLSNNDGFGISLINTDGTESIIYAGNNPPIQTKKTITAKKAFNKIRFKVTINHRHLVVKYPVGYFTLSNLMLYLASDDLPKSFVPFHDESINCSGETSVVMNDFVNKSYTYEYIAARHTEQMTLSYYDTAIDIQWIYDELEKLNTVVDDKMDKCGLITEYGTYQYLDRLYVSNNESWINLEWDEEYKRNGVPSRKITISNNAEGNSIMRVPLDNPIDVIETIGVYFYIDRTVYSLFPANSCGIKIRLCSDSISNSTSVNYYEYLITKKEMVQGWNFVKKRIQDFTVPPGALPNPNNINYIYIEVCRSDEMNGMSLYLNSFVFNQKMKPTVLVCFDGTYDTSVSNLYPYMQARGVKGTIFLNSKRTLAPETVDGILKYKLQYGWDIGLDSCHPDKKQILVEDDNYRNQYVALLNEKEWLKNTIVYSPVAFSSSYGNLRPITVPILKDMGIKMAKTDGNGYCGFFSDKDFSLPSHSIDINTTLESVIDKIDYTIETGQTLILYTTDVTEYGGETIAKRSIFEKIIDYISERIQDDNRHIDCLTFSEFYNKCIIK